MKQADRDQDSYPNYVLGVLVVVYVFNFLDRQILSILNEHIKADLGVTDAEMGFLYGTVFAVFYAIFGIPLGRLADVWSRTRLISLGLAFWSVMTALSGGARNFVQLAAARIGVGIGEASASPAAYSLLSDYFPPARRATVLAIYSSGIYIGAGLGLFIGGQIVERWDAAFGTAAPFGLRGWQVAFMAVGLPGVLLSLWVATLREPPRGGHAGAAEPESDTSPLRAFLQELGAVVPPFTIATLWSLGGGARAIAWNLLAAGAMAGIAWGLIEVTGTAAQWWALGIGSYAAFSWAQTIALRDPEGARIILRNPALVLGTLGFACLAFTGYGTGYWAAPFFQRFHHVTPATTGLILGGSSAVAGWLGVTLGGVLADRLTRTSATGRLQVGMLTALAPLPVLGGMLMTPSLPIAFALSFVLTMCTSLWLGAGASSVQDLVPPRLRATASAAYLLVVAFIGLALGPYTVGQLSVRLGDLRIAIFAGSMINFVALALFMGAARHLGGPGSGAGERP